MLSCKIDGLQKIIFIEDCWATASDFQLHFGPIDGFI